MIYFPKRFDFIFSYWIFLWYVLFIFKFTKYNPIFAIILGIIINIIYLAFMIYYKNDIIYILLFIIINFCIKVIPLLTLRNTKYNKKDIYALIFYFTLYYFWVHYNNSNISFLLKTISLIKHNKPFTPLIYYITKLK